jgi:PIN domain nuclease of toxin-antitoxin system
MVKGIDVKLLLDTHALLWWFLDDQRLPSRIDALFDDPNNTLFVSAATSWELATKHRNGKLREAAYVVANLPDLVSRCKFTPLPITLEHGNRAGLLPGSHKDPFDRMLAAQAIVDDLGLVTLDPEMAKLGAHVVW